MNNRIAPGLFGGTNIICADSTKTSTDALFNPHFNKQTKVTFWVKGKHILYVVDYGGLLDKFQYCDSNIELFSIAPPLVIDLPTLR